MNRYCRGFGVLEAIVALALIGGAGLVLIDWITLNISFTERATQRELETSHHHQLLAALELIDPTQEGEGEILLDESSLVRWQATQLAPWVMVQPLPGGIATTKMTTLFSVEAELLSDRLSVPLRLSRQVLAVKPRPDGW